MALFVPLQLIDSFCRCCGIASTSLRGGPPISVKEERRLAELLIADASSIFDIVRWRRVSKIFREVADKRLRSYTRVDVRMYDGIARLHKHVYEKSLFIMCALHDLSANLQKILSAFLFWFVLSAFYVN